MGKKKNKKNKNKKVEMLSKELKKDNKIVEPKVEKMEEETKEETKITVNSETNKGKEIPSIVVEDKSEEEIERKEKFRLVNELIDELFPEEEILLKDMVDYNKNRKTYIENKKAFENQYGDKDLFEATSQFFIDEAKKEVEWIEARNKKLEEEKERAKKKAEKAKKKSA